MTDHGSLLVMRADASRRIGLGHVRRCQSLAAALQHAGARVEFVLRPGDDPVESLFDPGGFGLHVLPRIGGSASVPQDDPVHHAAWLGTDWCTDARQTIDLLRGRRVCAVVVDHYAIDARWHAMVAAATGARIVVVDDIGDRRLAADLIVDHNFAPDHGLKYRLVNQSDCPILGGPEFALLARAYLTGARNPATHPVRSIGIFMGGVDLDNHSASVLHGIRDIAGFTGFVEIATTSANPNLIRLRQDVQHDGNAGILVDLADLAGFFGRHELHVGAGGGATWERCCIGAPTLALVVADNQRPVLEPLGRLDVVDLLNQAGPVAAAVGERVRQLLDAPQYRRRIARNAMRLVDGLGCERVSRAILGLCQA